MSAVRFSNLHQLPSMSWPTAAKFYPRTALRFVTGSSTYQPLSVNPIQLVPFVGNGSLRVTLVGHATLLVQGNGVNVLTDPIWSGRASPLTWVGPRRWAEPGIRFSQLPPIHVVVLSHDHYDHMDKETLLQLQLYHHPHFVVPSGNKARLVKWGIDASKVVEMRWGDNRPLSNLNNGGNIYLSCVPAHHYSGRSIFTKNRTLWSGWVITLGGKKIYFAGDTAFDPEMFNDIHTQFPQIDVALLPIGDCEPRGVMGNKHLSPEEAIEAHRILRPTVSIPCHHGVFDLSDTGQFEPGKRLERARTAASIEADDFPLVAIGGQVTLSR